MTQGAPTCSETDIRATPGYSVTPAGSANKRTRRFSAATGVAAAGLGDARFPLVSGMILDPRFTDYCMVRPVFASCGNPFNTEEEGAEEVRRDKRQVSGHG